MTASRATFDLMHSLTDRLARLESPLARYLACPALVLLALATFSGIGGGNTALFLLLVGLVVMVPVHARALVRDPIFLATVAFLVWVLVVALDPGVTRPDDIAWVRDKAAEWARVILLPALLVGFWLSRTPRLMPWLPLLIAVGYTIKVLSMTSPEMLDQFMAGRARAGYDNNITHFGIYSAISLFAVTASIWTVRGVQRRALRVALYGVVAACGLVAICGLVFSQTRAAWLATVIVIGVYLVLGLWGAQAGRIRWRTLFTTAVIAGAVLVVTGIVFHDLLADRLRDHAGTILALLQGEGWRDPPSDSVGHRISIYQTGLLTWLERPWWGHGPGIDRFTVRELSDPARDHLLHFHNMYIKLLATWGAIGFALFAGVVGLLVRRARRAFVAGAMPAHIGCFLLASTFSLLLFGLFDQILLDKRLPFLVGILGGIATAASQSSYGRSTPPLESVDSSRTKGSEPIAHTLAKTPADPAPRSCETVQVYRPHGDQTPERSDQSCN